jgi:glycosyltransferase involved in cell wall biosynthesis
MFRLGVKSQVIHEISNVPSNFNHSVVYYKRENDLRLVFLARVCKKKNIGLVLHCLSLIPQKYTITFDVYGPEEDGHWNEMNYHINLLPSNVTVSYKGSLRFDQVESVLANYHAYILPSKGENFGHSIYEAMVMGLPVIISDQTPWRNLEVQKVGFDIALNQPQKFVEAIIFFASQSESEWKQWSDNANNFALKFYSLQNFKSDYTNMFKSF